MGGILASPLARTLVRTRRPHAQVGLITPDPHEKRFREGALQVGIGFQGQLLRRCSQAGQRFVQAALLLTVVGLQALVGAFFVLAYGFNYPPEEICLAHEPGRLQPVLASVRLQVFGPLSGVRRVLIQQGPQRLFGNLGQ